MTALLNKLPKSADEVSPHIFEHEYHINVASPSRLYGTFGKYGPARTTTNNDK